VFMKKAKQSNKKSTKHLGQVIEEQYLLRLEIIGQKITQVFYHFNSEQNQVHISDMKILHLPLGCLWIKTDNGNMYKIGSNFLSWNELDRGILLEKADKDTAVKNLKSVRNRSRLACWQHLINKKITIAEWNWKGIHNMDQQNSGTISRNFLMDQMFKESLYPENLILHFENNQKMHIIAADPDEKIEGTKRYNLITAGQELMVFFCQDKLAEWGLSKKGFEIAIGNS